MCPSVLWQLNSSFYSWLLRVSFLLFFLIAIGNNHYYCWTLKLLFPENTDLVVGEGGMVADLFMRCPLSLKTGGRVGGKGTLADSSNPFWLAQHRRFPNHACGGVCVEAMLWCCLLKKYWRNHTEPVLDVNSLKECPEGRGALASNIGSLDLL